MGLVTITLRMAKGPKGTTEIVVSIKRIMGMAHLVPETAGRNNKPWFVNDRNDLETFNIIEYIKYRTVETESGAKGMHQQNVKTSPGPPRGVMVPLVLLVHPDPPPWSTFSAKFQKVWIRMDRSGPGGPRGPQHPLVDQERSGPPWTMLRHFPDAPCVLMQKGHLSYIN